MTEVGWATPEALGRLTITQLLCLGDAKGPGSKRPTESAAEAFAALERIEAEEARWSQD